VRRAPCVSARPPRFLQQRRLAAAGLAALLGLVQASPAVAAQGPVPPGSWVYPAIQYLKTRGVMPLWAGVSRPMLPDELRRAVEEARRRTGRWILRSYDRRLLDRLAREAGLDPGGSPVEATVSSPYGPLGLTIPSAYLTGAGWMLGALERDSGYQASAAAVTLKLGSVSVLAGRSPVGWGVSPLGGMIFSEAAGGIDQLSVAFEPWPWLRVHKVLGQMDDGRWLIGTRADIEVADNFRVGLSEANLMDGSPYPPYFFDFPLMGGGIDYLRNFVDNFIGEGDVEWVVEDGFRVFADYLVDDYVLGQPFPALSVYPGHFPSRVGAFAGFEKLDVLPGWDLYVQYTIVPNWTYAATGDLSWAVQGFPTGFPLGNDFDLWYGKVTRHLDTVSTLDVWASYLRKGEGTVTALWTTMDQANAQHFLSGVVEYSAIVGVDYSSVGGGWAYTVGPWAAWRSNAGHVAGAVRLDLGVQLSATYRY
jgi:hypothetical protein